MEEECTTASFSEPLQGVEVHEVDVEEGDEVDVEEGEISSDSASVEEITEEDFKRQEQNTTPSVADNNMIKSTNNNNINGLNNNNINFNQSSSAGSRVWTMQDLYKYQVSTKYSPGLYNLAWAQAVQNKPLNEALNMDYSKSSDPNNGSNGDDVRVVIDVDDDVKEDGELEEGEIDLDSEVDMDISVSESDNEVKVSELEKRVNLIRVGLESLTIDDAEKSFEQTCSKLGKLLDDIHEIVLEASLSEKDGLINLLIERIQTVNNVFCTMIESKKEQNKDILSRFLDHLTNQKPLLFSPEQLKEIELMISASTNIEDQTHENTNQDSIFLKKCDIDDIPIESINQNGARVSDYSRLRGISVPLLDLHMDHDADTLPSPTREAPPCLPSFGVMKPEWPLPRQVVDKVENVEIIEKDPPVYPYETDPDKAVSSYQQKFVRNSYFMSNCDLPSPTPSENSDNEDESDISVGEVISNSIPVPTVPIVSTVPTVQGYPLSSGARVRDPRLRVAPEIEGPALKRQRNETKDGIGGWLEDRGTVGGTSSISGPTRVTVNNNLNENLPIIPPNIQSLLKDIAVNPSMWMNILKDQQKSVLPLGSTNQVPIPEQTSVLEQKPKVTATVVQDEAAKLRMKRRDPRRALQENDEKKSKGAASAVPDIGPEFMKNLKNIANNITVSPPPPPPQVAPTEDVGPEKGPGPAPGPSRSHKNWQKIVDEKFKDADKQELYEERIRRVKEHKELRAKRKLSLVLDLDHTLLNSAKFSEVEASDDEILRKKEEIDREKPQRHLFRFPQMGMWTKLRPGVWNFLEKASKICEMHLCTMGNKLYATEMAKVLDPKGVLFNGRVIARGDDNSSIDTSSSHKDLAGVLGLESDVLVIDDSPKVWPFNSMNLITVERYIYFPCSRRQFGLSGPSLMEIDHDERAEDGSLAIILGVIERIHKLLFENMEMDENEVDEDNDGDVRVILGEMQRRILVGCHILFSRVIPLNEDPLSHSLWKSAVQFGATCTNTHMDDNITHVVARGPGFTDKVLWAHSTGRFAVTPGWLEASTLLYRRANEHDFAIKP